MIYIRRKNSIVFTSIMAIIAIISIASLSIDTTYTSHRVVTTVDGLQDPFSVEEIADRSLYIIKGTVKDIKVFVDEKGERFGDKPIVFTDAVIAVEEDLTGKYTEKEITVRTLGGISEGYETQSFMHPKFEQNEQVVLFVGYEPESEMGDNYFVYGNNMGKYLLKDGVAIGSDYPEGLNETQFFSNIRQ